MADGQMTIRGKVGEDRMSTREGEISKAVVLAKDKLRLHRAWFDKVAPKHIDAEQFVSLCLGVVDRGSQNLKLAVLQNPDTFFTAASECARLGLVPGSNFFFVPFKNGSEKSPRKGTYEITGIIGYKGMVDMIYRTGAVSAVHSYSVRAEDKFDYEPGEGLPAHVVPPNEQGQRGLGLVSRRGFLTGTWAFAAMTAGGHSQPVVLGSEEVLAYRARAKTFEFWGPPWPQEGKDTVPMWKKTGLRRLYEIVPHSTEYRYEMARALSAAQSDPLPGSNPLAVGSAEDDSVPELTMAGASARAESAGESAAQSAGDPS
jgi:recombination protein RecT